LTCTTKRLQTTQKILDDQWAHGGEGASAPSCRAPQGRDQTPGEFVISFFSIGDFSIFLFFFQKSDLRQPQIDPNKELRQLCRLVSQLSFCPDYGCRNSKKQGKN